MSAFYFVAVAIIFTVCFSVLCLIFVPKIRESLKPPAEKKSFSSALGLGGNAGSGVSSRTALSKDESSRFGVKILSSPATIAQLEEENRKLKQLVGSCSCSGQTFSSVLSDAGVGSRGPSSKSNGSMAESDAGNVTVTEKEKLVTFGSPNHDDVENHKQMAAINEEEGDAEDEETLTLKLKV